MVKTTGQQNMDVISSIKTGVDVNDANTLIEMFDRFADTAMNFKCFHETPIAVAALDGIRAHLDEHALMINSEHKRETEFQIALEKAQAIEFHAVKADRCIEYQQRVKDLNSCI